MAQTYTLEEAADKLNLSAEDFKRRLRTEWTQIRSFRDGATLRFRANEIDELARSYGLGSSDELPLPEASGEAPAAHDAPLKLDDSDETFVITPEPSSAGASSKRLKQDSDIRLKKPAAPKSDDEESILTEEFDVPADGSGKLSGKSGKLSAAKLKAGDSGKVKESGASSGKLKGPGSSGKIKGDSGKKAAKPDSSSEFELSLDPDSDEFELSLAPDSSEEVALGEMPPNKGSSKKSGNSGINLNRPTDSGVSLEKKKPAPADDEEIDFELSLETPGSGASSKKLSSGRLKADSDSEFELTLEEPSDLATDATAGAEKKGDIFEATDFDIPALEDDSASEAVSLDEADTDLESSDFDLALDEADADADDESHSEVVALDDDEVAARKKKGKKKKAAADDDDVDLGDVDLEEGSSASAALRGVRHDDDDDEEYEVSEAADEEGRPVAVAGPARWGALPAIFMFPTVVVMFLGAIMAFEALHATWGYQQANKPTTPLVNWFANTLDMKPAQ
ncbi:MAG TPA: hypothetical protein VHR66_04310 [Gemmataceae bacterium]|jgi:hypothetical protein|nr:hypothetical protein [Gemmataceae bacterium]